MAYLRAAPDPDDGVDLGSNPQRAIAIDANTLILLPLSGQSGHRAPVALTTEVAIDPKQAPSRLPRRSSDRRI
jgi:hypothetical protein